MKSPETKPVLVKIIVSLLVAAAALGIGVATGAFPSPGSAFENFSLNGKALLRVILMAGAVIAVENVLKLILSLGKPKSHRAQTIISLVDNVLRYLAGIRDGGEDAGSIKLCIRHIPLRERNILRLRKLRLRQRCAFHQ